jgi:hypothetical protein
MSRGHFRGQAYQCKDVRAELVVLFALVLADLCIGVVAGDHLERIDLNRGNNKHATAPMSSQTGILPSRRIKSNMARTAMSTEAMFV